MFFSPARATVLIASGVIAAAGLAVSAPTVQAVPGGAQPTELDYECDTVKTVEIEGKSGHFKLTATGNCVAHNDLRIEDGVDPENKLHVGAKKSEKFWTCDGAEGGKLSKAEMTFNDCVVGVPT